MTTLQELDQLRSLLEEKIDQPSTEGSEPVNDREVQLFAFMHRIWGYVPFNLVDTSGGPDDGRYVLDIINDWVFNTYGLRFRLTDESVARKRKREPR